MCSASGACSDQHPTSAPWFTSSSPTTRWMTLAPERVGGSMLSEALLCVDESAGHIRPRWLTARDEVWVRGLLDALDGQVGRTVDEAERTLTEIDLHGAPPRAAA